MTLRSLIVEVHISAEEYLAHYQGIAKDVLAHDLEGRVVKFPSNILQKFVTHDGIHGNFAIFFDENNKFHHIDRV